MKKMILSLLVMIPFSFSMAQGPCAADMEKFCKDVEKGGGKVHKCMKDNEANLSPECKSHMEKMKSTMKDVKEACMEDAQTHCMADGKKMGRGHMRMCMKKNADKFSDGCKEAMKDMRGMGMHKGGKHEHEAAAVAPAATPAVPAAAEKTEKK